MANLGAAGLPRNIFYKHGGVEIDAANKAIYIKEHWYHASEITFWEHRGAGVNIYLTDPNLPMFRWKTIWNAKQDRMCVALRTISP